jgi:phospho-N-acetylmuramoyl-pentapeptide-transferase
MGTIELSIGTGTILHILGVGLASFLLSLAITPLYTTLAYRYQFWKRLRSEAWSGGEASVYKKLHALKHSRNIPTMAGLIFIASITLITLAGNLERSQTWLPLAAMLGAGAVGFIDDWMNIRGSDTVAGMRSKLKFALHSLITLASGWWFFAKLGITSFYLPFLGDVYIGILMILVFWFVVIATANAVNMSDGLDGLAGGLLIFTFLGYATISIFQQQYALAGFCLTVVGALLSYTWFNIYPARFFMGDVGSFALGTSLGVVAMLTDTLYILPILGIVFVAEAGSVIINRTSRKLRNGKRVFLSSPIHHHFEAIGWPEAKVTMRFWIIGQTAVILGIMLYLITKH